MQVRTDVCLFNNWSILLDLYDLFHKSGFTGLNSYFHAKPNKLLKYWIWQSDQHERCVESEGQVQLIVLVWNGHVSS